MVAELWLRNRAPLASEHDDDCRTTDARNESKDNSVGNHVARESAKKHNLGRKIARLRSGRTTSRTSTTSVGKFTEYPSGVNEERSSKVEFGRQ